MSEGDGALGVSVDGLEVLEDAVDGGLVLDELGGGVVEEAHLALHLVAHHLLDPLEKGFVDEGGNFRLFGERDGLGRDKEEVADLGKPAQGLAVLQHELLRHEAETGAPGPLEVGELTEHQMAEEDDGVVGDDEVAFFWRILNGRPELLAQKLAEIVDGGEGTPRVAVDEDDFSPCAVVGVLVNALNDVEILQVIAAAPKLADASLVELETED